MRKIFFALCISLITSFLQAQVTIGSDDMPRLGSLLDLRENDNKTVNSTKGLLLPRVQLTHRNNLFPMFEPDGQGGYKGVNKNEEDLLHTGMIVYLPFQAGDPVMCPGVYFWDGNSWKNILRSEPTQETDTHVYDREGNQYTIASFGEAGVWMTQNLRSSLTPCGELLTRSSQTTDKNLKQYEYPNKDASSPIEYGLLYNWHTATNKMKLNISYGEGESTTENATPNDPAYIEQKGIQGICPNGWHLPSDKEWNELEKVISENPTLYSTNTSSGAWNKDYNLTVTGYRGTEHGKNMKSPISVEPTNYPNTGGLSKTDGTGFNAYLLGYVINNREISFGSYGFFWTSTSANSVSAWARTFISSSVLTYPGVSRIFNLKDRFYSIRCKKND